MTTLRTTLGLTACVGLVGCALGARDAAAAAAPAPAADRSAFEEAAAGGWKEVLADPCTGDWRGTWVLDGEVGTVTNTPRGMELVAGPEYGNDAHHMVLWTREAFTGDLRLEYEYTRLDREHRGVTILYIQATGSNTMPYAEDIMAWAELRRVPAMKMYFNHMHTYHISYAAYPNPNDPADDYVRARRYTPEQRGLKGTDLVPDYLRTGLFQTDVPHRITVVKRDQSLSMRIRTPDGEHFFHWRTDAFPPVRGGRIGLRHMYTRAARYRDFRLSVPE